jgi:hypothetical protein
VLPLLLGITFAAEVKAAEKDPPPRARSSSTTINPSSTATSLSSQPAFKWRGGIEGGLTLFSEELRWSRAQTFAAFAHVGYGRFLFGVHTGVDVWRAPVLLDQGEELVGVWFVGPQLGVDFADGRASSRLGGGLTVVVQPTVIDQRAGSLGFYLDARPLGFRFPLRDDWFIGLDPLGVRFLAADTGGIPLLEVHFLTVLRVEVIP